MGVIARQRDRLRRYTEPLPLEDFSTYEGYWTERQGESYVHPRWTLATAKIPDGASVLDVGCGDGGFLAYLRAQRPQCRLSGIDVSAEGVRRTRERGIPADVRDLTRDDLTDTYDYVTCFEAIEHIQDAEVVLQKMRDATREALIMSLPNVGYWDHRVRLAVFGRFPNTNLIFHAKEHIRFWTVRDFTDWAEHFGLRVMSVEGQYGGRILPWRRYPSLFSPQVLYVLKPGHATANAERSN